MYPGAMEKYDLNNSARAANKTFETEGSAKTLVAVRGMALTYFFRALMELLTVPAWSSSDCDFSAY